MIQAILFHTTPQSIAATKTEVIADTGAWFLYYYFYYFSFIFFQFLVLAFYAVFLLLQGFCLLDYFVKCFSCLFWWFFFPFYSLFQIFSDLA